MAYRDNAVSRIAQVGVAIALICNVLHGISTGVLYIHLLAKRTPITTVNINDDPSQFWHYICVQTLLALLTIGYLLWSTIFKQAE